ncbi:DUF418 domain-containing protein [Sphingomonas sp. dw_22]|uniref:DUF418 domain-containing protein n=1 Tax=Sphingomonas sp. dw_22 TaxID=2721175 RepID=UPI001BD41703|nr:DUF418 domain-containing protein [Sphingomonas sp. dw_22]
MSDSVESKAPGMAPVADRIHVIDSLRAAALCGVILFNIVAMVAGFLSQELLAKASPVDLGFAAVDVLLIQGKARSCFALLFGVGFGILMERAASRGQDFTAFYLRRMAVLLAIGLCNLSFLFFGDILILYAIMGMVMLLFRGWSSRALLIGGLALIVAPPVLQGILEAIAGGPLPNLAGLSPAQANALMPASIHAYQGSDYAAYVAANWRYYLDMYWAHTADALVYNASVLGLFLLGLWTARNGVLADVERWRPFLRKVAWWCLPIGLLLSVVQGSRHLGIPAHGVMHGVVTASYAALAFAAFGYIALLCLFLTRGGRPLQKALAPMGRMALTGYLTSNAIGSFVFYGWGLGRMSGWSVTGICLFGLAIFAGLCAFSAVWLRFFRFGPAEWVWRSLTYGRLQPLRKVPAAA